MRERPILFSGPMVRAILEGRKTMTRRVTKAQCSMWDAETARGVLGSCPYGQPGDRLWVRETWGTTDADHPRCKNGRKPQKGDRLFYAADKGSAYQWRNGELPWRPSIFMPRWAARIALEIVSIRVERVQDITPQDAYNEGVLCSCLSPVRDCKGNIEAFHKLWDSINAKRGYGWDANPWVWMIEFKRADAAQQAGG